ncbi:LysR family transcriptional regulator [Oharaeibacter diazotrophicus]|uniref:LysR family transcriptional regulator n=1 Tax=Oharaeibacter diazotrophicus TaxID=1920512 RepID=A0A4R6RFM5_9HYPH|nr:LysR family transcriptional regulator [Oharaeibacter diazotrophicus]TDP84984.1 LysR family transcriptional regulator [Oharaeibacter diazotrophicus]BBE73953.1 HTH-type transcriptional regulator LeuO [Pleomorphomonas sp. SM30]GLS76360.1 LysR family transcriptional regulator [Oharaeibacter diazotrophicus]
MRTIDDAHIRRLDMTLLLVFEGLIRQGKMGAVGAELGLTQSAVSHAVGRLRAIFDDQLFVRRGAGVEPTRRAVELAEPIGRAIAAVRGALRVGRSFDPMSATRMFRVAAFDSAIAALAPRLIADLAAHAPGCTVTFRTLGKVETRRAVLDGTVDLAVGVDRLTVDGTVSRPLLEEGYMVAARAGHPAIGERLDLDTYCALGHVLVSPSGDPRGIVDDALAAIGRSRRVMVVMPQFVSALMAASRSDAIVTAPARACRRLGKLFDLEIHEPPLALPGFTLALLTRADAADDPALAWFGDRVAAALADGD